MNKKLFKYVNDNLISTVNKDSQDNIIHESTYNYLDKKSKKEYRYSAYLFGDQWKNNRSLDPQFGIEGSVAYEISENYVLDYCYYSHLSETSIKGTFSYEFDSNDYLIKQIENISWSADEEYKIITTYEYTVN